MTDNGITTISKNYAKALIEVAEENNSSEIFRKQLHEVLDVLNTSSDLSVVMDNSSISISKKIEIINSVFENKIDTKILNFLKLLVEKNRFQELGAILNSYDEILQQKSKRKNVKIISARNLNFEERTNILFKLEKKLNNEIIPEWIIDESIIAGLTFKFDDYVIDTSVRTKIESLSKGISR